MTALVLSPVVWLQGDRTASPLRRVIYIGSETQAPTDEPFRRFRTVFLQSKTPRPELTLDYLSADDSSDATLDSAIRRAVPLGPSVLVTPTGVTAAAARRVAPDIPCIFSTYLEPVRGGFAVSLDAPGHHRTGLSLEDTLDDKRIEILKDAYPSVRRIAVLGDHDWATLTDGPARVRAQAARSGLDISLLEAESAAEVETLLQGPSAKAYDAWYVAPTYVTYIAQTQIINGLRRLGQPAIFGSQQEVAEGGLMSYSQDTAFVWPAVAALVDRVLDGEDPGSIPVERPRRFVLAVRVSDSPLGQSMAPAVIRRADFVY